MTATQEKIAVPPIKIAETLRDLWAPQALKTAIEIGIFASIAKGYKTADEIAAHLKISQPGAVVLLDALTGLEFLTKSAGKYELTEVSQTYLLPEKPLYAGEFVKMHGQLESSWSKLTEAVKSGKPVVQVNEEKQAEEFFPALAAAIFPMNFTPATLIARELEKQGLDGEARVLDIAAGSAVWSIPLARLGSTIKVDALDFPGVLSVARDYTKRMGVDSQYAYLPGNWRDVDLEKDSYDVIVLGHILHSEGRELSAELLIKCHHALKPGGFIIIAEFLSNTEKTLPAAVLLFAINMFLVTTKGCVFSQEELSKMLTDSGFVEVARPELAGYGKTSPVMVARKR